MFNGIGAIKSKRTYSRSEWRKSFFHMFIDEINDTISKLMNKAAEWNETWWAGTVVWEPGSGRLPTRNGWFRPTGKKVRCSGSWTSNLVPQSALGNRRDVWVKPPCPNAGRTSRQRDLQGRRSYRTTGLKVMAAKVKWIGAWRDYNVIARSVGASGAELTVISKQL